MEIKDFEKEALKNEPEQKNTSETVVDRKSGKTLFTKPAILGVFLVVIILSSLFGAIFGFIAASAKPFAQEALSRFSHNKTAQDKSSASPDIQKIVVEDSAVTSVVEKATPAVVSIVVSKEVSQVRQFGFPFFGMPDIFDDNTQQDGSSTQKQKVGGGSGFFISEDGMIVTNKHVVDDSAADYTVITNDDKEYSARVLARDPVQDIAIIKIEGNGFPVMPLGNSESLKIGQTAIAIGNSLGEFSNTVSKGIISGLKRSLTAGSESGGMVEQLSNIIQTDAAINPGNSGGPLIDIVGNAVGVNVAVAQNAQNVGFALPIDQVKRIIEQVQKTGKITTPFLGVRYLPITKQIQQDNNLPFEYGVLVQRGSKITDFAVIPGSPADKAGIIENDIILEINGKKIDSKTQLADLIAQNAVGETVTLKVWHKGDIKEVQVVLQERK